MSILAASLLAQVLSWSAGERSESRLRLDSNTPRLDVLNTGEFALHLRSTHTTWDLSYAPSYSLMSVMGPTASSLLRHSGTLNCRLVLSPKTSVFIAQSASYGERSLRLIGLSAVPQQDATTDQQGQISTHVDQPRANSGTISDGTTNSNIIVTHRLAPRWQSSVTSSYFVSQGLDTYSRSQLPRAEFLSLGLTAIHGSSAIDQFSLTLSAQNTITTRESWFNFEPGFSDIGYGAEAERFQISRTRALVGTAIAEWRHLFNRRLSGRFAGGISPVSARSQDQPEKVYLMPTGTIELAVASPVESGRLTINLGQQLTPVPDRYTGAPVLRTTSDSTARWTRKRTTVGASLSVVSLVSNPAATQTLRIGVTASQYYNYQIGRQWTLEGGVRETWQQYTLGTEIMIWAPYLAVAYSTGNVPF